MEEEQNRPTEGLPQQPRLEKDNETSENQKRENKETTDIYRQHQHETTENQEHLDEAVVKAEHAQDQVMIAGITELAEELSNLIISTAGSELCSMSEPIEESPSFPVNFDEYSAYSNSDDPSYDPPGICHPSSSTFIIENKRGEDIPSLPADNEEQISSYPTAYDPSGDPPTLEISPPVVSSETDVLQVKSAPDVDMLLIVQVSDHDEAHNRVDVLPKSEFAPETCVESEETKTELEASNEQESM
jgi:hypothetical protein